MKIQLISTLFALTYLTTPTVQATAQSAKDYTASSVDTHATQYANVARQIWEFAEVGYQETRSSALLMAQLEAAGFSIQKGVAGIPTAFVASYGRSTPVIGLLAEYDALPGISQDAVPVRKPLVESGPGHACGHHLFGTGSTAAAIAVKEWLTQSGTAGTIRLYGTPAEEGGAGKVYLVRDGLFDDVDVVLHWHPGDRNDASPETSLANRSAKFRFRGVSSHAAGSPERGRSALDGVYRAIAYLNSFLSNAVDYQAKAFNAPILVTGTGNLRQFQQPARPAVSAQTTADDLIRRLVESVDLLPLSGDGALHQIAAELGQTVEIVRTVRDGILDEVPEARFYHALRQQSDVTGPGAERSLGDAVTRCKRARAGYDRGQVALHQMAMSMLTANVQRGDYGRDLPQRLAVFRQIPTDAFARGLLDHTIDVERPVIPVTEGERLANEEIRVRLAVERERIATRQGLVEAGYSDEPGSAEDPENPARSEVDRLLAERQEAALNRADLAGALFGRGGGLPLDSGAP